MLTFASICPHPPIIIPSIGSKSDLKKVKKTIESLEILRKIFEDRKPETLLIISPHGPVGFKEMTLIINEELSGDFSNFGDSVSHFSFKNNSKICKKIEKECFKRKIPFRIYRAYTSPVLDHGVLVPLYYLTKNQKPKIVPLNYSLLDSSWHFIFGEFLGEIIKEEKEKIGIIASGDLSHCLSPEAPAGYSPSGEKFDNDLIEFLKKNDIQNILNMDPNFVREAGECGYRSIIILLGVLSKIGISNPQFEFLSYEKPFGVGYLVGYYAI